MSRVVRVRVFCGAVSLAVHSLAVVGGATWIGTLPPSSDVAPLEVEMEPEARSDGASEGAVGDPASRTRIVPREVPAPGAGVHTARVDTGERGRGGDRASPRATHLSDHVDDLDLARQMPSHLAQDQLQRVKSARERKTIDDRRAAMQPMEFSLVATGEGTLLQHADAARVRPHGSSAGSLLPSLAGAEHEPQTGEGERADPRGARDLATPRGASDGDDLRPSVREDVARARPMVDKARPTVPAEMHSRRTADNVDSLDLARAKTRSLVHASFAGASDEDIGRGGEASAARTAPGTEGSNDEGSRAVPLGTNGATQDFNARDPRFVGYFHELHKKIDPLWRDAFPKELTLALKQGTVILEFDVAANGSTTVVWPPKRPSGFPVFDENCASAIRRASPFPPIPPELAKELARQGAHRIRVTAPFSSNNSFAP